VPIPDYQSLMRPLLEFAADGSEKNIRDAVAYLAAQLKLSNEDRDQLLPSGKQTLFSNRVHWARTYLDKAGAIKRTRRSHLVITERGKKLLSEHPTINAATLKQFPEFVEFQSPKVSDEGKANVEARDVELLLKSRQGLSGEKDAKTFGFDVSDVISCGGKGGPFANVISWKLEWRGDYNKSNINTR
jgi:restriction endonuclease Mrr